MDMRIDISKTSRTMYRAKAAVLTLLITGLVYAATSWIANKQPWGYIAPPALSSANLQNLDVYAYTPWFEEKSFKGELLAYPVANDGSVSVLAPKWRASIETAGQHYLTGRNIATTDGSGNAIPFIFDELTPEKSAGPVYGRLVALKHGVPVGLPVVRRAQARFPSLARPP